MDFKHAISALRDRIKEATTTNLNREEDHIKRALVALRERLEERPNPPSVPMPIKEPHPKPVRAEIDKQRYPEIQRLTKIFEELDRKLAQRNGAERIPPKVKKLRKELRGKYDKEILEIFFEVADKKEIDEYLRLRDDMLQWEQEDAEYKRRLKAYKNAQKRYNLELEKSQQRGKHGKRSIRYNILNNIERDLRLKLSGATSGPRVSGRVSWELLPKGTLGFLSELNNFVQEHGIAQRKGFEAERLNFAYQLNPQLVYVGRNEFDSYFVFLFDETGKVLLENPFHGNAAFVFHTDWKALSKLSRTDLTLHYKGKVDRIIHSGPANSWKQSIRRSLKLNLNSLKTT